MKARVLPLDSDEHRRAQELLPWFVNGTLGAEEAGPVAAHLAECARCRADAREQAALHAAAGAGAPHTVDVDRSWASLRSRLQTETPPGGTGITVRRHHTGVRAALVAQFAVIVALAVALAAVSWEAEPYRAMGAPPSAQADALIVFSPDATNQQMRTALEAAPARIVGGPTVTAAYLIRLGATEPAALARLRAQPGVVTVESLRGAANP